MSRTVLQRVRTLARTAFGPWRRAAAGVAPAVEGLERRRMLSTTVYLSDLASVSQTNGLGPVELDTSNGGGAAGDGNPMNIGGKSYRKGLGVRAGSAIVYHLGRKYDRFISAVGVDREGGRKGSVYFQVFLDGTKVYDSGEVSGGQRARVVSVNTAGKRELKLVVGNAGGGKRMDHADWANARLTSRRNLPPPIPAAPADLAALAASPSHVDLSWADESGNERQFRVERSTDGTNFSTVGTVGANATEYHDDGLAAGTTYYYRVLAANAVGESGYTGVHPVNTPAGPVPEPVPENGKPTAASTGPTDPSSLTASGSIDVTTDGAVIENVDVHGTIMVYASNVTIRNFRVRSDDDYGIFIADGADHVTISDGELTGSHIAAISGANFTAIRLNVHHVGVDGIKASSGCVIDSCYIHDLGMDPNAHADGIQGSGGGDLTIRNNNIDVPEYTAGDQTYLSNSAIFVHSYFGPVSNVLIKDNWLNGGNYTVYSIDAGTGYGPPTDVRIENNVFGPADKYGTLDVDGG